MVTMPDCYALKLFCSSNFLKCFERGMLHELMDLIPWTLQEEVMTSPRLERQERLLKVLLTLKLLLHCFELSHLVCGLGVWRRFISGVTVAVTVAEDSVSPGLLNTALALIGFVLDASEDSSFSRMGTHCLENFFGLVPRESLGDGRYVVTSRIIAKMSLASNVMRDLDLSIPHRARDNVGGTLIGGCRPRFTEREAERLFTLPIPISSLESSPAVETDRLPLDELRYVLSGWSREDHHPNDPAYGARFVSKPSKARIPAG
jgi:hypothetical protein